VSISLPKKALRIVGVYLPSISLHPLRDPLRLRRFRLPPCERFVAGTLAKPPRVSQPDEFPVEARAVGQNDVGQGPAVLVLAGDTHGDGLANRQSAGGLLRVTAERLAAVDAVDAVQADLDFRLPAQDPDRVAFGNLSVSLW